MKVFITKYALTSGIEEKDVEYDKNYPGMVSTSNLAYYHGEGEEWHRTLPGAVIRAEAMRLAKIASLKKSIASMEKLDFSALHQGESAVTK